MLQKKTFITVPKRMIDIANNVAKHPLPDLCATSILQYSYMAVTKSILDRIKRNDRETQNRLNILPTESLLRRKNSDGTVTSKVKTVGAASAGTSWCTQPEDQEDPKENLGGDYLSRPKRLEAWRMGFCENIPPQTPRRVTVT